MVQEHSAGAIIFRIENGKHLYLLMNYGTHWEFVKGHIEKGESLEETVRREAVEETGIRDLVFVKGFDEKVTYFFKRNKQTITKDVVFLLAETKTKEIRLSFEHKGFAWLSIEDAVGRATFKNAKDMLKKADGFLNQGPRGLNKWAKT